MMKHVSLAVSLLLVLTACKEDETTPGDGGGGPPVVNVDVLGTWKLDAQSWRSCTKPQDNLEESNLCGAAS